MGTWEHWGHFTKKFRCRLQAQNCHIIWSLYQSTSSPKGTVSCTGALFFFYMFCLWWCSSNEMHHITQKAQSWTSSWLLLGTLTWWGFVGLACQGGMDMVFRFIIEYNSLRDFGPPGNNNNNNHRSIFIIWGFFKDMIYFGLCWNLRLVTEL